MKGRDYVWTELSVSLDWKNVKSTPEVGAWSWDGGNKHKGYTAPRAKSFQQLSAKLNTARPSKPALTISKASLNFHANESRVILSNRQMTLNE